jgi:hypothetical protein
MGKLNTCEPAPASEIPESVFDISVCHLEARAKGIAA